MCSVSNENETVGEILQCDAGFTFVDFIPKIIESGFFKSTKYENFRDLVHRANEFLRSNTKWKIVSCESVHFKLRSSKVDPIKVTFTKNANLFTSYIRGLRIWLTERKDEKEREQQIGYISLIPQQFKQSGLFSSPKYETLYAAIERFNSMLKSNPLPGRIITIDSKEMAFSNFDKFDPDFSKWSEDAHGNTRFVFVIRIFYEIMDGISEEIGLIDFKPGKVSEGGFFEHPVYEPFSSIVKEASTWLSQQGHLRFCNAQTLEIKVSGDINASIQRMACTDFSGMENRVRILRMAYTKPLRNSHTTSEKSSQIWKLTCRDFVPVQLKTGLFAFEYENLSATKQRISEWVKSSGVRVLSAETTTYRVKTGGEKNEGTEATFSGDTTNKMTDESWIFLVRLYLEGVYTEPPPAVPKIEQSSCHIS